MILNTLYPAAISRGMTKRDFFHSTPNDVWLFLREHNKRARAEAQAEAEKIEYTAWLNGVYIQRAVASVLSKKAKYPKQPLGKEEEPSEIICTEDMTAEEKKRATDLFFGNLMQMKRDFERTNRRRTGDG